ncbi:CoA transferase [Mesorhizobium sp. BR1-1-9]|uniref:CoA transferase n=1 Tax=Mesorhizobium sp. BR1-1-9 TaxID=2876646 RepID=UPI001CD0772F|nr:CoA transferase [Mesorhizobium sp. BR1-1-9]MBZ9870414.1 CoA transferase [Mesorhizobium sp. BR1-1-9]
MNRFIPSFEGPLAGIRVVEVGSAAALAFGARLLADLGAEVIKIEPPDGDPLRNAQPLTAGGESALFAYLNHGKRIVALDTNNAEGQALQEELVRKADLVLAEGSHIGSSESAGSALKEFAGRPVTVAVSPHGLHGSGASRHMSSFVLQHASGFAFHQASPVTDPEATPPVGCADWEADLATGLMVAISSIWAIEAAGAARPGPVIDMSQEDALVYLLVEPFADWQSGADVGQRQRDPAKGLTIAGGLVWYLPCADGSVMVSPREDHQWPRWCEVMGNPAWTTDASLCGDRVIRTNNAAEIQRKMAAWSTTQLSKDVVAAAQSARVACFPVSTPRDLIENVQLRDRGFYSQLRFESGETIPVAGLPFRFVTQQGEELARGGSVMAPARKGGGDPMQLDSGGQGGRTGSRDSIASKDLAGGEVQ